jgi:hypothetical protein
MQRGEGLGSEAAQAMQASAGVGVVFANVRAFAVVPQSGRICERLALPRMPCVCVCVCVCVCAREREREIAARV